MIFKNKKKKEEKELTDIDKQLMKLVQELNECTDPARQEVLVNMIKDMAKVKVDLEGGHEEEQKVNPNTVVTCVFTGVSVILIILAEKTSVLNTKVWGILPKFKFW